MTPFLTDDWLTIYGGDCREVLATLPAESVHCVVTSPPYFGLRDYGVDGQIGLEPTVAEYVETMVGVFRQVRRVLRSDGTLWLVLGDSYWGSSQGWGDTKTTNKNHVGSGQRRKPEWTDDLKPKDLVGIPWRVAFALQADGWYLRSDVIWAKPNPMPESVTDRPTKSHEYLFLLAKSPRYFFDADAVRETGTPQHPAALSFVRETKEADVPGQSTRQHRLERPLGPKGEASTAGMLRSAGARMGRGAGWRNDPSTTVATRNIRSVWTIPTQPYPGAHFAVFPPKLVEPCIRAGCPELGTVMDPFAGSGTVGVVAQRLSRRAVLIDLNPDYLKQQLERNQALPLGLSA